jgi:hypothetical protein
LTKGTIRKAGKQEKKEGKNIILKLKIIYTWRRIISFYLDKSLVLIPHA